MPGMLRIRPSVVLRSSHGEDAFLSHHHLHHHHHHLHHQQPTAVLLLCSRVRVSTAVPMDFDTLACEEEMMEATPEGAYAGPSDRDAILARRQLSAQMNFCASSYEEQAAPYRDPVFEAKGVLENMLRNEERMQTQVQPNYFKTVQTEVVATNRAQLTSWMYEVCDEERWGESVYLRAVSYLDRVLSVEKVHRQNLQLLGCVSLLLSAKFSGVAAHPTRLAYLTDNSVSVQMILNWEILVADVLHWDMATIVPTEFLDQFITRIPPHLINDKIMERAKLFISFCASDHTFLIHTPSIIASAALAMAVGHCFPQDDVNKVLIIIQRITSIELDVTKSVMDQIGAKMSSTMTTGGKGEEEGGMDPGGSREGKRVGGGYRLEEAAHNKLEEIELAETPTDVGDVHF